VAAVRGDHVGVQVADERRAAELARDPLGLGGQVVPLQATRGGRRGRGEEDRGLGELAVDELELLARSPGQRERDCEPLTAGTYPRNWAFWVR
jgi:hypothetical protein